MLITVKMDDSEKLLTIMAWQTNFDETHAREIELSESSKCNVLGLVSEYLLSPSTESYRSDAVQAVRVRQPGLSKVETEPNAFLFFFFRQDL